MRDHKNIIKDVNDCNYKTYKESNLNFDKMNKKELLIYLMKLIENTNKYVKSNIKSYLNLSFNSTNLRYSFSYAYRIYTKEQLLEAITTVLFSFKRFLNSNDNLNKSN